MCEVRAHISDLSNYCKTDLNASSGVFAQMHYTNLAMHVQYSSHETNIRFRNKRQKENV